MSDTWAVLASVRRHLEALDPASAHITSEVSNAVVLSAVAFESFLNGVASTARSFEDTVPTALQLAEALSLRLRILDRVRIAHVILVAERPDFGGQPLQDLKLLTVLRNHLVHRRPVRAYLPAGAFSNKEGEKLVRALASKGLVADPEKNKHFYWKHAALKHPVGVWAHDVVIHVARWFSALIPQSPFSDAVEFDVRNNTLLAPPAT